MSYNLYLNHKENLWDDKPYKKIQIALLKKYLSLNPNIKIASEDSSRKIIELEYFLKDSDTEPYFYFRYNDGSIETVSVHTDKHALKMLLNMADSLGVTLRGEAGETYNEKNIEDTPTYEEMEKESSEFRQKFHTAVNKRAQTNSNKVLTAVILFLVLAVLLMSLIF